MKLKIIKEEKKNLGNIKTKKITFAPEKNNQLLTYQQIRDFVDDQKKKLPFGSKMVVRALNMQRDTNLYSSYSNGWKTDKQWDDYLSGKAEDVDKFKHFYNFTIDIQFA